MLKKLVKLGKSVGELIQKKDEVLLKKIQKRVRHPLLDPIMQVASKVGSVGLVWIPPAFILLCKHERLIFLIKHVGGYSLNFLIKNLIRRHRPGTTGFGYSFPSGHSMAVSFGILTYGKNALYWSIPLGTAILLSRVYLNKHYPSDVLAGFTEGLLLFLI